jgi:CBS domain-containing protein
MDSSVTTLMESNVVEVGLEDTVDRVEEILDSHDLSCVPVIDADGKCFGVISAPDLVHFHKLRKNSQTARAWEICTHKVVEVTSVMTIREAAETMAEHRIHHLVVTKGNTIIGIVSSIDIVKKCLLNKMV